MEQASGGTKRLLEEEDEDFGRRKLQSLAEMRTFHEKQVSLIERLPAAEVGVFLETQRERAAALIQTWWRRYRTEVKEGVPRRGNTSRHRVAAVIQRYGHHGRVEGREREILQAEIDRYRRENPPPRCSEREMRETHSEVQQLLGEFYSRQQPTAGSTDGEEKVEHLLEGLDQVCALLDEAPQLGGVEREGEIDMRFFSAHSQSLAVMAQQMHLKEMRASGLLK